MATPPSENGRNVRFVHAEVEERAAETQEILLDLLETSFVAGHEKEVRLIVRCIHNNNVVLRTSTLMRAGEISEAVELILRGRQRWGEK